MEHLQKFRTPDENKDGVDDYDFRVERNRARFTMFTGASPDEFKTEFGWDPLTAPRGMRKEEKQWIKNCGF